MVTMLAEIASTALTAIDAVSQQVDADDLVHYVTSFQLSPSIVENV